MTDKNQEFVLSLRPTARCGRGLLSGAYIVHADKETPEGNLTDWLGDGDTEKEAWRNTARKMKRRIRTASTEAPKEQR